uniref:Uncharacterized protein n=1 Tax=viral metagenome TaxID=1070528 RepID=A0A6C0E8C5_9ZZZZ
MQKYSNIEIKHKHGKKTVRKVFIHKNKGYKSVCEYKNGKCSYKNSQCLSKEEMKKICAKKFIPGLFTSCSRKTRKLRR